MTYISSSLRDLVYKRANGRCEYCLLHDRYTMKRHEIDHVYAEKHGGETDSDNLCLSCFECNRYKGSDLCSLDKNVIVSLFHPHNHSWHTHFRLDTAEIVPLTATGRVTIRLLRLNESVRLEERINLHNLKRYP